VIRNAIIFSQGRFVIDEESRTLYEFENRENITYDKPGDILIDVYPFGAIEHTGQVLFDTDIALISGEHVLAPFYYLEKGDSYILSAPIDSHKVFGKRSFSIVKFSDSEILNLRSSGDSQFTVTISKNGLRSEEVISLSSEGELTKE